MSELSVTSAVAVPTIKFYLRENLLAAGERTAANQASYGEEHVARLRIIRALIDVGGLSVAAAREVLTAIDSDIPLDGVFATAQRVISADIREEDIPVAALAVVDEAMAGWQVSSGNPGRLAAGHVLGILTTVGQSNDFDWVARYADAALLVAEADLDAVDARAGRAEKAETVVVGTVLGDALLSGLRRAAQEHVTALRFASPAKNISAEQTAAGPRAPQPLDRQSN